MIHEKKEYLTALFARMPSAKQLTDQFGIDGWQLCFMTSVDVYTQDEKPPTQQMQVYFVRSLPRIQRVA